MLILTQLGLDDAALRDYILQYCLQRASKSTSVKISAPQPTTASSTKQLPTICPSEIARALSSNESQWRALMPHIRQAAYALADQGQLQVLQRGKVLNAQERQAVVGPIRLRVMR